ncbi:hypothetical protein U1Q18_031497, partial [Sarracenia purpurea var. burkii]
KIKVTAVTGVVFVRYSNSGKPVWEWQRRFRRNFQIARDGIRQRRRRTCDPITEEHFFSKIQHRSSVWGSRRAGSKLVSSRSGGVAGDLGGEEKKIKISVQRRGFPTAQLRPAPSLSGDESTDDSGFDCC